MYARKRSASIAASRSFSTTNASPRPARARPSIRKRFTDEPMPNANTLALAEAGANQVHRLLLDGDVAVGDDDEAARALLVARHGQRAAQRREQFRRPAAALPVDEAHRRVDVLARGGHRARREQRVAAGERDDVERVGGPQVRDQPAQQGLRGLHRKAVHRAGHVEHEHVLARHDRARRNARRRLDHREEEALVAPLVHEDAGGDLACRPAGTRARSRGCRVRPRRAVRPLPCASRDRRRRADATARPRTAPAAARSLRPSRPGCAWRARLRATSAARPSPRPGDSRARRRRCSAGRPPWGTRSGRCRRSAPGSPCRRGRPRSRRPA